MGTIRFTHPPPAGPAELILQRLDEIKADIRDLARSDGRRLTRREMRARLGDIDYKTLKKRLDAGDLPPPGADGKWLLADIIEWERLRAPGSHIGAST